MAARWAVAACVVSLAWPTSADALNHFNVANHTDATEVSDPTPLAPNEQYLAPFVEQLAELRDSPIGRRFIFIAELVDVLPSWLVDWFVPLVIPHSTLTIPLNKTIPIAIPGLPSEIELVELTVSHLNEFTALQPARLLPSSKFTWESHIGLKETVITLNAKLELEGVKGNVTLSFPSRALDVFADIVVAFDRARLCEVWGRTMRSSASCALQPFFVEEAAGASGLNVTDLRISLGDFDLAVTSSGFGVLGHMVEKALDAAVRASKPTILANLPTLISAGLRAIVNELIKVSIARLHDARACPVSTLPVNGSLEKVINVSRVCIDNNAAFVLEWAFANCPRHEISRGSGTYPVDVRRCMDVREMFPDAVAGDLLRVQTHAVAGIHQVLDPAFRYVPNSNAAAFECSGTTLQYDCDFVSVAPVDPSELPKVSQVCIVNQAGFVMYFDSIDARTRANAGRSGTYPINQRRCASLGGAPGVQEGDRFEVWVKAILGRHQKATRDVQFQDNGPTATFQCRGTTLDYTCDLMTISSGRSAATNLTQVLV